MEVSLPPLTVDMERTGAGRLLCWQAAHTMKQLGTRSYRLAAIPACQTENPRVQEPHFMALSAS